MSLSLCVTKLFVVCFFILLANGDDGTDREITSSLRDIFGIAFSCFAVMVAAGGGIGGGCLMVPILIVVLDFDPKIAIPISSAGVWGASLANLLINWRKRHPHADRPLIAWDIILMMEPLTVFGTIVGSYLNIFSPSWLLVGMLVLLLGTTTIKIMMKGRRMFKAETIAINRRAQGLDSIYVSVNNSIPHTVSIISRSEMSRTITGEDYTVGYDPDDNKMADALKIVPEHTSINVANNNSLIEKEKTHSWMVIFVICFLTAGVLILCVLKTGMAYFNPLNIECGTRKYWIVAASVLPFSGIIYIFSRWYSLKIFNKKKLLIEKKEYTYVKGDVKWNRTNTIKYPFICSFAGIFAGLFGIGGGVVKGPLMLEMHVLPSIASATSATMIIFTSSAATLQYLLFGSLNLHFAPVFLGLGFVSAMIGRTALNFLVSKYNRQSLIVFIIGLTVGSSTIAMAADFVIHDLIEGKSTAESSLC